MQGDFDVERRKHARAASALFLLTSGFVSSIFFWKRPKCPSSPPPGSSSAARGAYRRRYFEIMPRARCAARKHARGVQVFRVQQPQNWREVDMSSTSSHSSSTPAASPFPLTEPPTEPPTELPADAAAVAPPLLEPRHFVGSVIPGASLPVHPRSYRWVGGSCVSDLTPVPSRVRWALVRGVGPCVEARLGQFA